MWPRCKTCSSTLAFKVLLQMSLQISPSGSSRARTKAHCPASRRGLAFSSSSCSCFSFSWFVDLPSVSISNEAYVCPHDLSVLGSTVWFFFSFPAEQTRELELSFRRQQGSEDDRIRRRQRYGHDSVGSGRLGCADARRPVDGAHTATKAHNQCIQIHTTDATNTDQLRSAAGHRHARDAATWKHIQSIVSSRWCGDGLRGAITSAVRFVGRWPQCATTGLLRSRGSPFAIIQHGRCRNETVVLNKESENSFELLENSSHFSIFHTTNNDDFFFVATRSGDVIDAIHSTNNSSSSNDINKTVAIAIAHASFPTGAAVFLVAPYAEKNSLQNANPRPLR